MNNVLFEGESILIEGNNQRLWLTTHRLRYLSGERASDGVISIFLDNISSIQVTRHANRLWLILGFIALLAGGVMMSGHAEEPGMLIGIVGIVFIIRFFIAQKHVIKVASKGGDPALIVTSGMKAEMVNSFIDSVEKAMNERMKARVGL